jgi:branched-chain amino acid transport system substrate-binding protein
VDERTSVAGVTTKFQRLVPVVAVIATVVADPAAAQSSIVVAGPATGRHAGTLQAMMTGARKVAVDEQITDVDDGCDAARAEGAARMIATMRPDVVVGHPCPAAAIAAARVYAETGVLFISLGVRHPDLTTKRAGPSIFRLAGREDRQGAAAAEALTSAAPGGRIAIIQDRTAYARALTADIVAAMATRKIAAPTIVPIVAGRREYTTELAKFAAAPPEAIFFAGYPSEAAVILSGLRKSGLRGTLIASDANATEDFAAIASAAESAGIIVKVMTRPSQSGGMDLDGLEVAASTAVTAWRDAAARAGSREPSKVAVQLTSTSPTPPSDGQPAQRAAMNRIEFDESGDARVPSYTVSPLVAGRWSKSADADP